MKQRYTDLIQQLSQPDKSALIPWASDQVTAIHHYLEYAFQQALPVGKRLRQHSQLVDQLLSALWPRALSKASLIAIGGYGRRELYPYSDVDCLILVPEPRYGREAIAAFIRNLWDANIQVSHSIRTPQQVLQDIDTDLHFYTSLLESRCIKGDHAAYQQCKLDIRQHIQHWPTSAYFQAKLGEQQARHQKYRYNLEPSIKSYPGTLRDLHTLQWLSQHYFQHSHIHDYLKAGLIRKDEYRALQKAFKALADIRFANHLLSHKKEDRLLFAKQKQLAKQFGYQDNPKQLAVEQFMQQFYRHSRHVRIYCRQLYHSFAESLATQKHTNRATRINDHFEQRHLYLCLRHNEVYSQSPGALLEGFLILARRPQLLGFDANTIRQIRAHRHLIDTAFRQNHYHQQLFLSLFDYPQRLPELLEKMYEYGILRTYLPEFAAITGQMQFDLFHTSTVDLHTLSLIRLLQHIDCGTHSDAKKDLQLIRDQIGHFRILYLAALYHDIGKGTGQDHATAGAELARQFGLRHQLPTAEIELITWLVQHHLTLSLTAQKTDITDPEVIKRFAKRVNNLNRLNHLYLLTICDIEATNPALLTEWKASLLANLYHATKQQLSHQFQQPQISTLRQRAIAQLDLATTQRDRILKLWHSFPDHYFRQFNQEEIQWQSQQLASHQTLTIALRNSPHHNQSELIIYRQRCPYIFATTTAALDALNIDIAEARFFTNQVAFFAHYILLDHKGGTLVEHRLREVLEVLNIKLESPHQPIKPTRRKPLRNQHFNITTDIRFQPHPNNPQTLLYIDTQDRPGLLADIALVFSDYQLKLHHAKISTFGEQAQDCFTITTKDNQPFNDPRQRQQLTQALTTALA